MLLAAAALPATFYELREAPSVIPLVRLGALLAAGLYGAVVIDRWRRAVPPAWLISGVLVAATLLAVFEWRSDVIPLLVLHHFIMEVASCKLIQPKKPTDFGQIIVLALLLLTLAGVISPSLWFVLAVLLMVTVGVHAMIALHMEGERQAVEAAALARGLVRGPLPSGEAGAFMPHRRVSALAGVGMMVMAALVFLAFPRVKLHAISELAAGVVRQTGIAPQIRFDGNSIISESERPVCRVTLTRDGDPVGSADFAPYFRLYTQDTYHQPSPGVYAWRDSHREERAIRVGVHRSDLLPLNAAAGGPLLEQRYFAESLPRKYLLFHVYPALSLRATALTSLIHCKSNGALRTSGAPRGGVDYTVVSIDPEARPRQPAPAMLLRRDPPESPSEPPPVAPRVRELALRLAAEAGGPDRPAAVAERMRRYLLTGPFTYTLDRADVKERREPVEDLLFASRKGHCEYFATALAVMCQVAGVPARMAAGYRGGQFNELGGFYQVREKDAHAWVEVFDPRDGWLVFDPTPPGTGAGVQNTTLWARISDAFGYLQYVWVTTVVAFDTEDQASLWEKLHRWTRERTGHEGPVWAATWAAVKTVAYGPPDLSAAQRAMYWLILMLLAVWSYFMLRLLVVLGRRTARWSMRVRRGVVASGFFMRILRALARRGFRRPAGQTPREFAQGVAARGAQFTPLPALADAYYRHRFGGRPLDALDLAAADRFLKSLD